VHIVGYCIVVDRLVTNIYVTCNN